MLTEYVVNSHLDQLLTQTVSTKVSTRTETRDVSTKLMDVNRQCFQFFLGPFYRLQMSWWRLTECYLHLPQSRVTDCKYKDDEELKRLLSVLHRTMSDTADTKEMAEVNRECCQFSVGVSDQLSVRYLVAYKPLTP